MAQKWLISDFIPKKYEKSKCFMSYCFIHFNCLYHGVRITFFIRISRKLIGRSGYLDVGDIFWLLLPDANVQRKRMLVIKAAKTVTNISQLSPTHFVSNIRQQHQCSRLKPG